MIVQYENDDMPKKIESTEPLLTDWLHMVCGCLNDRFSSGS